MVALTRGGQTRWEQCRGVGWDWLTVERDLLFDVFLAIAYDTIIVLDDIIIRNNDISSKALNYMY